jgi:CRP-like cAMP-binding protein
MTTDRTPRPFGANLYPVALARSQGGSGSKKSTLSEVTMDASLMVRAEFRRLLSERARTLGLTKSAIEVLVSHSDQPVVRRAESRVGSTQDCADYVRILVQGAVKTVCHFSEDEDYMTIQLLGPGDFLCVVAPEPRLHCRVSVVAHSDVTVVTVTRAHVLKAMGHMQVPDMGRLTSWAFVASQRVLYRKLFMHRWPMRQRIVSELVALIPRFGQEMDDGWLIDLELTQDDIAHLVAVSRSNVCRTIVEFEKEGLIRREGQRYQRYWIAQRLMGAEPSSETEQPLVRVSGKRR